MGAGRPAAASQTATHVIDTSTSSSTAREIATARRADSVAFLHRAPFALDAYELGFLPGFREDCGYQQSQSTQLDIPVGMLDNISGTPIWSGSSIGSSSTNHRSVSSATSTNATTSTTTSPLLARFRPATRRPGSSSSKSRTVIDAIPEDLVLATHEAMLTAWRTNSPTRPTGAVGASILGGSPPKQLEAIRQLTRPTLSADPPADIVGVAGWLASRRTVR